MKLKPFHHVETEEFYKPFQLAVFYTLQYSKPLAEFDERGQLSVKQWLLDGLPWFDSWFFCLPICLQ
jgi:hypothetical protein